MEKTMLSDFDTPASEREGISLDTALPPTTTPSKEAPAAAGSETLAVREAPLPPTAAPNSEATNTGDVDAMRESVIAALKSVYDPEIPVDVYELGLIYKAEISDEGIVDIDMTLTAPACPVAEHMPVWVRDAVSAVEGVREARVNMVFDPPWDPSRMSDEARLTLDMF